MLSLLHIENVAVVEKTDIEFESGLNVLTGETGAGKSIVIDSLEAALGWRTSKDIVRRGAKNALATAVFTEVNVSEWLKENGLEVIDTVCPISARLIVNLASMKLKKKAIMDFIDEIRKNLAVSDNA